MFEGSFYWHEHPNCIVEAVSDLRPERRSALMQTYRCDKSYESLEKLFCELTWINARYGGKDYW